MSSPEQTEKKLTEALQKTDRANRVFIPPTLDEAILKQARTHFENPEPKRQAFGLILRWAIGLAVIALVIYISTPTPKKTPPQFAREDINRDGQVNILDAMTLAKLAQVNATSPTFDQNNDGKIDDTDITAIAEAAVRLN